MCHLSHLTAWPRHCSAVRGVRIARLLLEGGDSKSCFQCHYIGSCVSQTGGRGEYLQEDLLRFFLFYFFHRVSSGIALCHQSEAAIGCHIDRRTIKEIIPGGLIWSKMMNTCVVHLAIQFPLPGIHCCLCFIFPGKGNADLLERAGGGNNFLVL